MVDFTALKYNITAFRTKKTYLIFLICQMFLAVAIVPIALSNPAHFRTPWVIFLEVILFLLLAFDLLIVRWISEGQLCKSRCNIFDLGVLLVFAATLIFLMASSDVDRKDYREFLQTDDAVILVIIITRYLVQVTRLICEIKSAKTNRILHEQIKKIDLNDIDLNRTRNNSLNFHDIHQVEQYVRQKIVKKNELIEEP